MPNRLPCPALRPFVQCLWTHDGAGAGEEGLVERVLPTGCVHVVFRLSDDPVRLFDGLQDTSGRAVAHAVVGGARSSFYLRDPAPGACSVGALLQPGAAPLLLGMRADELAERHTPLEDVWGAAVGSMRARLAEAPSPAERLDRLEALLLERRPRLRALHPAVAHALERFASPVAVGTIVAESGYSHRCFNAIFREHVGLTPKVYCRVRRLGSVLSSVADGPSRSWADIAQACGYFDEAHLSRDFADVAGLPPGRYRSERRASAHHVVTRRT